MTNRQKYALWTSVVVILLIAFLWYYFRQRKLQKTEKCPDGRNIPATGNCADNPPLVDSSGNVIVTPSVPDASGCTQPSSYVTNAFPLGLGMKGDLVKQLQMSLNVQYGNKLTEDGYFGCFTLEAVRKAFNVDVVDAQLFKDKVQSSIVIS